MSKRRQPINNVVVISDTHIGCKVALCHPDGAELDDGGTYMPSKFQLKIWNYWKEFWGEWVPRVTKGEPFIVVHNGDVMDGVHHNSTTQWSHNLRDQVEHARKILEPVVKACDGRYYQIRGTEAHVGKSGTEEERLARELGAIPSAEGMFARYELWLRVKNRLCHFLHHVGTTSSAQHEASAINAELSAMYTEAGRWGQEPPTIVIRSHRHRSLMVRLPTTDGYAISAVTPAWQGKTPFAWKIPGARITTPQFGGLLIRYGDEELYTRDFVRNIGRSAEVVAEG